VLDVDSLADMYIFNELVCDPDIYLTSFFMDIDFAEGLETINSSAFQSCYQLKDLHLPTSLNTIGSNAFRYCNETLHNLYPDAVICWCNPIQGARGSREAYRIVEWAEALRKLTGVISRTNCIVIFINQLREKVGIMFGNPETTTGGRALKFYSSVRLDVRRIESLKMGGEVIGNRTRVKIVKNKVAPPFREAEFDIMFGKGISREGDILDLAVNNDVINKSGAWFSYEGEKIGQGRENTKVYLKNNPAVMTEIENKIRELYDLPLVEEVAAPETAAEAKED